MEFNELNLAELDKDLTPEERDEWQAIYASYRSHSLCAVKRQVWTTTSLSSYPRGRKNL